VEQPADLPGEVIPEVAPDHTEITGVDMDDIESTDFQPNNPMSPVEIPGVDTPQQTIEIRDLDVSSPPGPTLIEPRQSG
jgi:hypothetical protein